ncbi:hypothetical protein [Amycolatopsis alkalitolerans]|uniref:Secreted protein n=1 Tax=Amycolatopsis alkalitolerans TaxID=2547244 RepID=A0A5C4LWI8_9PSEU|nr:hypothetical protein [Amycolatopsis alkalitolerans]TNC22530.1 hypothetical protein FG385_25275 [Amycolatopsis alkalitolerans]
MVRHRADRAVLATALAWLFTALRTPAAWRAGGFGGYTGVAVRTGIRTVGVGESQVGRHAAAALVSGLSSVSGLMSGRWW